MKDTNVKQVDINKLGWFGLLVQGLRVVLQTFFKATQKIEKALDATDGYINTVDETGKTLEAMATNNHDEVVLEGAIIEENSLYVGTPAQKIKDLDDKSVADIKLWAQKYANLAISHRQIIK